MFEELLCRTAQALNGAGIPYMIIGGQAVLVHGTPRMTQDVDVTLGIAPDQIELVLGVAAKAGWQILPQDPAQFVASTFVLPVQDMATSIRIDLLFSYTPFEREAIARAVPINVDGVPVHFVTAEDLVIHKIFAGRPRDLEDARSVMLKNPEISRPYVLEWLRTMSAGGETDLVARLESVE